MKIELFRRGDDFTPLPILNDEEHYRKLLPLVLQSRDSGMATFVNNLLIGNGGGLLGVGALLSKWPETKPLTFGLLVSGAFFFTGIAIAARYEVVKVADHHRYARYLINRVEAIRNSPEGQWEQTKAALLESEANSFKKVHPLSRSRRHTLVASGMFGLGVSAASLTFLWHSTIPHDALACLASIYALFHRP